MRPSGISVASLQDLLLSATKHFGLVTVHPEEKQPDLCYIGPVTAITKSTVTIQDLNNNAEWSGLRRVNLAEITRVDFGGSYERVLLATAPKRPKVAMKTLSALMICGLAMLLFACRHPVCGVQTPLPSFKDNGSAATTNTSQTAGSRVKAASSKPS